MNKLLDKLREIELHSTGKWFLLAFLVGCVSGIAAILFHALAQTVQQLTLVSVAGLAPAEAAGEHSYVQFVCDLVGWQFETPVRRMWAIVAIMAAGGLLSGWIVQRFAPDAEGPGTDAAIDAFHNQRGAVNERVPIVKTIASAITLGTGGSAGREGPIAQIGAGIGSYLAARMRLSARDRRVLLAAGMGAGVGAIFRAPLAGALFAGEILYRDADLEADVIVPAAVSSSVAYCVYSLSQPFAYRFTPLFGQDVPFHFNSVFEMLPYTVLGIVLVLVGVLYIQVCHQTRELFRRSPFPVSVRPMIGATLAGLAGLGLFYACSQDENALSVLGSGYGTLQKTFAAESSIGPRILLAIAFVKILTTALTTSSGGSGGVFGPSMVIGGSLGAAVGQLMHRWWPHISAQPQAYAIVGMAGFFAGCARAPISTILMVTEMTGNYKLLLPTMWVSAICFLLGSRWTLYLKQVPTRLDSPAHRGDFLVDVLEGIFVKDVYQKDRKIVTFHEADTLDFIVHRLAETSRRYFPVLNDNGEMVGVFSAEDVRAYLYNDAIWNLADANDVMSTRVLTVTPGDDLNTAMRRFTQLNIDEIPIVETDQPQKLVGMLRRREVIAAYNRLLMEHKRAAE